MNADILRSAGVDYDRGVNRFMGRAHLYEKTLSKFAKDTTFSRVRAAYLAGDREQLLADAHELKGMCGNIALTPLYEAANALVQLLRSGACTQADLDAAYGRLEKEYHIVYEAVLAALEDAT